MLQNRRHWLCDEKRRNLGNNCYPADADDVIGYSTKEKCEAECLGGASLAQLQDILSASGVRYPFDDILGQIVTDESLAAEFMKSTADDTKFYVRYAVNSDKKFSEKYYNLISGQDQIYFRYKIVLHPIRDGDGEMIRWHAYNNYVAARKKFHEASDKAAKVATAKVTNPFMDEAQITRDRKAAAAAKLEEAFNKYKSLNHLADKFDEALRNKKERSYYHVHSGDIAHILKLNTDIPFIDDYEDDIEKLFAAGQVSILGIDIEFTTNSAHATNIILDPNTAGGPTAFYVEPHVKAEWSGEMNDVIGGIFGGMFRRLGVVSTSMWEMNCPVGLQSSIGNDWGSCSLWNLLITSMCIMNPRKSKSAVMKVALSLREHSYELLHLFIFYLLRLLPSLDGIPRYDIEEQAAIKYIPHFDKLLNDAAVNAVNQQAENAIRSLWPNVSWENLSSAHKMTGGLEHLLKYLAGGGDPWRVRECLDKDAGARQFIDIDMFEHNLSADG